MERIKTLFLLMALAAIAWAVSLAFYTPAHARGFSDEWDRDFKKYAERYVPAPAALYGWEVLKAQCYQESLLKPDAVSPVGAMGLCQFMPLSFEDERQRLRLPAETSPYAPRVSILAAASYMGRLRRGWSSPRPEWDRMGLAMASYNAGMGNILKAQRASGGQTPFCPIMSHLHEVTGHHARETRTYVKRIWRWCSRMTYRCWKQVPADCYE